MGCAIVLELIHADHVQCPSYKELRGFVSYANVLIADATVYGASIQGVCIPWQFCSKNGGSRTMEHPEKPTSLDSGLVKFSHRAFFGLNLHLVMGSQP